MKTHVKYLGLVATFSAVLATSSEAVIAQDVSAIVGTRVASVTYGPYMRLEFGRASSSIGDGFWQSPGFPSDPQINFDLDADSKGFGSIAVGFDWQNGFRADVAFLATGSTSVSGPCSSASNGSSCAIHADIAGASLNTTALMGSVYYSPLEQRGSNSPFQPFIVGGLGFARSEVGPWTRENATVGQPTRTFAGGTSTNLAWSIGAGVSYQVTQPGKWPVIIEASWRYYDFGKASGGSTPLVGSGSSQPVTPLTFANRDHVLSVGLRIPLKRY